MTRATNPTLSRLNKQIKKLGPLTPAMETQAQICRQLARQLDLATGSATGVQSMAVPNLAKQLEASITKLMSNAPIEDPFLDDIFAPEEGQFDGKDARVWMAEKQASVTAQSVINPETDDEYAYEDGYEVAEPKRHGGIYPGCPQESRDAWKVENERHMREYKDEKARIK
jgi:hypothetical protein